MPLVQPILLTGVTPAAVDQPTNRYWPIQWTEAGIYLTLAPALAAFC